MQFHETGYGRRFFDQQLPMLIDAIRELAAQVGRQSVLLERHIELMTEREKAAPDLVNIPAAIRTLSNSEVMDKFTLKPGDSVVVMCKPQTSYHAVIGKVVENDRKAYRARIEFDPESGIETQWFGYEVIKRDR